MNCTYKLKKYSYKIKHTDNSYNPIYKPKHKYYKKMVGGFEAINREYIKYLDEFIQKYNETVDESKKIDDSHGLQHALIILCHTEKALEAYEEKMSESEDKSHDIPERYKLLVKLAALLHDIDDSKYFDNSNYDNARLILNKKKNLDNLSEDDIESII